MLEIAGELGVTEPRSPSSGPRPWSYSGTGSTRPPRPLLQRAAETGSAVPSPA